MYEANGQQNRVDLVMEYAQRAKNGCHLIAPLPASVQVELLIREVPIAERDPLPEHAKPVISLYDEKEIGPVIGVSESRTGRWTDQARGALSTTIRNHIQ